MMKKWLLSLLLLLFVLPGRAASPDSLKYTILLSGASFAVSQNGWFEIACRELGARPLNRAIGGESIADTANRMADGTLWSAEELDAMDAFVIMQVHNRDVFNPGGLKERYTDYAVPFDRSNYAAAFDYVIKRYITACYELKDNPASKYYGTPAGKPAVIVLCTDWHDGRVLYNDSVRRLAAKWGLPLVEFDRWIGFSRNTPHPVTGTQTSLLHAQDTQTIEGVTYGWHPQRGEDKYIQQRMAAIFVETMRRILPLRP
ncbi:DUF5040 domain-containing protein [uncultured Alistipes sp.]|uniref:DUF5040 domain-containing protein n=1 Tax=uncultured Alistipes sp. TaxID=538949 RepID=UPI002803E83C|nr:DUF5040 domain-containing protein [uncultured Alistipes sp.]